MDQLLLHNLHGVHLFVLLQPNQKDLGVAATPNHSYQVKITQPEGQALGQLNAIDAIHYCFDVLEGVEECIDTVKINMYSQIRNVCIIFKGDINSACDGSQKKG